jgi:hypothetical protein
MRYTSVKQIDVISIDQKLMCPIQLHSLIIFLDSSKSVFNFNKADPIKWQKIHGPTQLESFQSVVNFRF